MKGALVFLFCFQLYAIDKSEIEFPWMKHSTVPEKNIQRLIEILEGSYTGKRLVNQARLKANQWGKTLSDVLKVGENSLTDTTILRRFDRDNALEVIHESVSVVYINQHLDTYDAVLDLAHELSHFIYREEFNPYVSQFSLEQFIANTIEGEGGEADAYLIECQVNSELFVHFDKKRSGCYDVWDTKLQKFSREMTIERFYHLGPYFRTFKSELRKRIGHANHAHISKEPVKFYSSAHSVPYPVAAIYEFEAIVGAACRNDQKRMKFIQSGLRKPGSTLTEKLYQDLEQSFRQRCDRFLD